MKNKNEDTWSYHENAYRGEIPWLKAAGILLAAGAMWCFQKVGRDEVLIRLCAGMDGYDQGRGETEDKGVETKF